MAKLRDIFRLWASPGADGDPASGAQSDTGADEGGVLSLEYRDNPFASFMRKLEKLIDTDPREALRAAGTALADRIFGKDVEEKLRVKLDEIAALLRQNNALGGVFAASALGVPAPAAASPAPPAMLHKPDERYSLFP